MPYKFNDAGLYDLVGKNRNFDNILFWHYILLEWLHWIFR